ncbi:3-oxo-5-alpha-steroid 4-dehydrogenase-domain-containing protein [Pterulicium gracile]|uniref:3-oxo-5-alpha-steroid 4-dehydrogenase-domain-containing protein n=1 Tax=Pterulicium gracile TaxID=1884261 RepID=A0A5C3Q7Y7_9AGAR|nr:3-oxo-5-alpha-steroid 4-dehydrogenase-domain-containing protein [Pterula gracilis]
MVSFSVSLTGKPPSFVDRTAFPLKGDITTSEPTIRDVKAAVTTKFPKFGKERQKITISGEKAPLADDVKLSTLKGKELSVKDLGAQISWRGVYIIEYLGPILIHALVYHFPKVFYGRDVVHSDLQTFLYLFVLVHFAKREVETVYVHRFSHGTMPFSNVYKNCGHYWGLGGLVLAWDLYRPGASKIQTSNEYLRTIGLILAFAEVSNLNTHMALRALRPTGSTKRAIPYGYGFDGPLTGAWGGVSCPNYFFESVAWGTVAWVSGSVGAWVFFIVGTGQMLIWAKKKHAAYKKEFGSAYPKRKAMIPFIY